MKAGRPPRFDLDALRKLAGDKAFARGEAYLRDGQVELLSVELDSALARVVGTDIYRTRLVGRGIKIAGECSCRAFEDFGFCKHMVAVALAVNAGGEGAAAESSGTFGRIRKHLEALDRKALVDLIVDQASRDRDLFGKLDVAAAMQQADDKTIESRLRKAITDATRTGEYIDYGEARAWARRVDAMLESLASLIPAGRAAMAVKLVDRASERIMAAVESIDDSDGHCSDLMARVREIHLAACRAAPPEPVAFAQELFERETEDEYGFFEGLLPAYVDVLGERGLAEYRRLALAAWEKLPVRTNGGRARYSFDEAYSRLSRMLDVFAERDGDVETRIALRSKDLSSPWNYLQLAEFRVSLGRKEEALACAEEGLWLFEDEGVDQRLLFFTADLLCRMGRTTEAEAHLWRAFEKEPSFDVYQRLRAVGGEAARDRALAGIESRTPKNGGARGSFLFDLLVEMLIVEKMFARAWENIVRWGASDKAKMALAEASETSNPQEALAVYAKRIELLVAHGGDANYQEAHRFVTRMARLRDAEAQAAHIARLREQFARKRNFIRLLDGGDSHRPLKSRSSQ